MTKNPTMLCRNFAYIVAYICFNCVFFLLVVVVHEAAHVLGGGLQPELLPVVSKGLRQRRRSDGAHEVRPQGPQRVRSPR